MLAVPALQSRERKIMSPRVIFGCTVRLRPEWGTQDPVSKEKKSTVREGASVVHMLVARCPDQGLDNPIAS